MNTAVVTLKDSAVLTVKETADFLRISPSKAYQLVQTGILPSISIGRRRLIPKKQLLALLDQTVAKGGSL